MCLVDYNSNRCLKLDSPDAGYNLALRYAFNRNMSPSAFSMSKGSISFRMQQALNPRTRCKM
jgi:hypothetical protein